MTQTKNYPFRRNATRSMRLLSVLALISLCGCACANDKMSVTNPEYPWPDDKVADDLEKISESDHPYFWEWMERLSKYEDKITLR